MSGSGASTGWTAAGVSDGVAGDGAAGPIAGGARAGTAGRWCACRQRAMRAAISAAISALLIFDRSKEPDSFGGGLPPPFRSTIQDLPPRGRIKQPDVYPQGSLRQSGAAGGAAGIKSSALGEHHMQASESIVLARVAARIGAGGTAELAGLLTERSRCRTLGGVRSFRWSQTCPPHRRLPSAA